MFEIPVFVLVPLVPFHHRYWHCSLQLCLVQKPYYRKSIF